MGWGFLKTVKAKAWSMGINVRRGIAVFEKAFFKEQAQIKNAVIKAVDAYNLSSHKITWANQLITLGRQENIEIQRVKSQVQHMTGVLDAIIGTAATMNRLGKLSTSMQASAQSQLQELAQEKRAINVNHRALIEAVGSLNETKRLRSVLLEERMILKQLMNAVDQQLMDLKIEAEDLAAAEFADKKMQSLMGKMETETLAEGALLKKAGITT